MKVFEHLKNRVCEVYGYSSEKKYSFIIKFTSSFFICLPLVFMLRAFSVFRTIRMSKIRADRLGHFVGHPILCYERHARCRSIGLYWLDGVPCNIFWLDVLRRYMLISSFVKWIDLWNRFLPFSELLEDFPTDYIWDVELRCDPLEKVIMPLNNDDHKRGVSWLIKNGWSPGQKIVCIHIRDSEYLKTYHSSVDWSYHDFRDSDPDTFTQSIKTLVSKGAFVIRMGKLSLSPINISDPNFIDLPFACCRDDFIDIWLWTFCDLCITTTSGPHVIVNFYNAHWLCVDQVPVGAMVSCAPGIVAPKPVINVRTGEIVPFSYAFISSQFLNDFSYCVRSLTSDELLCIVEEAWEMFILRKTEMIQVASLNAKFWKAWHELDQVHFTSPRKLGEKRNSFCFVSRFYLENLSGLSVN